MSQTSRSGHVGTRSLADSDTTELGYALRLVLRTQPRSGAWTAVRWFRVPSPRAATPVGLSPIGRLSQGSSFLATLGWRPESRWDSLLEREPALEFRDDIFSVIKPKLRAGQQRPD